MLELARGDVPEGLWLRAERQTAGRGRQGRAWESPPGNLYASTLVRLRPGDPPAASLAFVAAVALAETVLALDADASLQLKWPNDLMLAGAKLSGILLERAGDAVVIGVGVNLAHHPDLPERRTTSLSASGVATDAAGFIERLADSLAAWLARWRSAGLAPIRERWLDLAHPLDTPLAARLPDGITAEGFFAGLSDDGALLLRLADGGLRVIHAADIFTL